MPQKVTRLSATKISTFEQCAKYYEFQYVHRAERSFTPIEWEAGSIVHNIIARLFRQIRDKQRGTVPKLGKMKWYYPLLTEATSNLRKQMDEKLVRIVRPDEEMKSYEEQMNNALTTFTAKALPLLNDHKIVGVEADLGQFNLDGIQMDGRLDLITQSGGNLFVHDWKTGTRRDEDARQAKIYYFASKDKYRQPATTFTLYYLAESGDIVASYTFSQEQRALLSAEITDVAARLNTLETYQPRVSVLCHWCPYGPQCDEGNEHMASHPPPVRKDQIDLGLGA
jgi:ATP-dependent exoDNAse (exonuclease V) beta subunit